MRTLQFTAKVSGEWDVTTKTYYDGYLTPNDTNTTDLSDENPVLGEIVLGQDSTPDRTINIPHFEDISGNCKMFRLEFSSTKNRGNTST